MRPGGSKTSKQKRRKLPFRQDLREAVTCCGELPYQHRGQVTDTLYIWTTKRATTWVDRRDLPVLLKAAGANNLDGKWVAEFKARKAEREKAREEKRKTKAKHEEVTT